MKTSKISTLLSVGMVLLGTTSIVLADAADPGDNVPNGSSVTELNQPDFTIQGVAGRTIGGGDPYDWYTVDLVAGNTYLFYTTDPIGFVDTVMTIYGSLEDSLGALNPLAFDDDGGVGLLSLITFTPQTSGQHFISISPFILSNRLALGYGLEYTLLSGTVDGGTDGGTDGGGSTGTTISITGDPVTVANLPIAEVVETLVSNGAVNLSGLASKALSTDDGSDADADKDAEAAAGDDIPELVKVEYRSRNSADGWSEWHAVRGLEGWFASFEFDAAKGTHYVQVRATDASGKQSIPLTRAIRE